jgi:triacylglycerol esterase/lipase EstA (alpha/beta hydrolase family)
MDRTIKAALGLVAGGLLAAACSAVPLPQPGGGPQHYPIRTQAQGFSENPNMPPPGANIPGCKPDATHPYPVVLVNGTTGDEDNSWGALAPMLANDGYCVYTFNYGQTVAGYAVGEIGASAGELATEVSKVLQETGAAKVDIVGHSQGGMMPRYYIKFLGGATKVNLLIGLVPSNHGTTADGLSFLARLATPVISLTQPALAEQLAGSAFLVHLNAGGDTVAGPQYVVISTIHDEVVTPYTSAFLHGPGVLANETVQQFCPLDPTGHISIIYDLPALTEVINWLGKVEIPNYEPLPVPCNPLTYGQGL